MNPVALAPRPQRVAHVAAFVSSAGGIVSIAVSHITLGAALVALALSPRSIRVPRMCWPLLAFVLWTLVSASQSADPMAAGPQVKKFFVYLIPVVIYSAFRRLDQMRRLAEAWFVVATTAALLSCGQFAWKLYRIRHDGADFDSAYMADRITGYFSHWLTFSEVLVIVLAMLGAYLLFSVSARRAGGGVWWVCAALLGFALVLSYTRSVWLAGLVAGIYLVSCWRPRLLWALPVLAVLGFVLAPASLRDRVRSIVRPDQNSARLIMWRTGANMIAARPVFGVGPERVGPEFTNYLPSQLRGTELPPAYYGHLHNMYIHYAAERGWPAALIIVWLLAQVIWDHRRALRAMPAGPSDRRALAHGVVAATLGVAVAGCFDLTLGDSEILGLYLAVAAIGYGAIWRPAPALA